MAREGYGVAPVDYSTSGLYKARQRHFKEGLPFQGVACDIASLPFKAASFDAAIDIMCSTHNPEEDQIRIFTEIARVLKPQGKLFSVMASQWSDVGAFGDVYVRLMDKKEIPNILGDGYADIRVFPSSYYLRDACFVENLVVTATRTGEYNG